MLRTLLVGNGSRDYTPAATMAPLLDVVPTAHAVTKLSCRDVPARVCNLVGTRGGGAAGALELCAAADRPYGLDPALDLLQLGHLASDLLLASPFRLVDGSDTVWRLHRRERTARWPSCLNSYPRRPIMAGATDHGGCTRTSMGSLSAPGDRCRRSLTGQGTSHS